MTGTGLSVENGGTQGQASALRSGLRAVSLVPVVLIAACGGGGDAGMASTAELKADLRTMSAAYAGMSLDELSGNHDALELAGQLFGAYCGDCHGADGRGSRGVPDLGQAGFDYGATADAVRTTIRDGRMSEMPGMGREYGEVELGQIVSYLGTLGSTEPLSDYDARGEAFYAETCAACHGDDGRGKPEIGASNLVDDYWQNGDSMMNIRLAITRGVQSECPAHGSELTPVEVELLTAFTLQLASR